MKADELDGYDLTNIELMRGEQIYVVCPYSRGTSHQMKFYIQVEGTFRLRDVTTTIAKLTGNRTKDGRLVKNGGGMDMIYSVLHDLNYKMAIRDTGKTIEELLESGECGVCIYDDYFIDADNYQLLG